MDATTKKYIASSLAWHVLVRAEYHLRAHGDESDKKAIALLDKARFESFLQSGGGCIEAIQAWINWQFPSYDIAEEMGAA